jgi:hypothetical protein
MAASDAFSEFLREQLASLGLIHHATHVRRK